MLYGSNDTCYLLITSQGNSMLVNKTDAAKLAGISRKTLYTHIDEKGISITKDKDESEKIDISELERVYGFETIAANRKKLEEDSRETSEETSKPKQDVTPLHTLIRVKEQEKEIEKLKEIGQITKQALEDKIAILEDALKESREEKRTFQALLENHSEQKNSESDLQKSFKALEARVSNSESAYQKHIEAKEKAEAELERYKKAYSRERNKTWLDKLLGRNPKRRYAPKTS